MNNIDKVICENSKYGSNFINELSQHLKIEFLGNEGYSPRNLARMRKFYATYNGFIKFANSIGKFAPWSFNCLLIDKVEKIDKRVWYAEKCIENGWSRVVLENQIDLQLYERQEIIYLRKKN